MEATKKYLSVAFFAFLVGAARYGLNQQFSFYGTFAGNILGCFLLAFLTYLFLKITTTKDWLVTGLSTGFVGAFTTFSSFNLDTLKLLAAGQSLGALLYFLLSILCGFFFAFLGKKAALAVSQKMIERS